MRRAAAWFLARVAAPALAMVAAGLLVASSPAAACDVAAALGWGGAALCDGLRKAGPWVEAARPTAAKHRAFGGR